MSCFQTINTQELKVSSYKKIPSYPHIKGGIITGARRLELEAEWGWVRSQMVQKGSKGFKMVQIGSNWFTMIQNGAKWLKMVKKGAKWFRKVQNGSYGSE